MNTQSIHDAIDKVHCALALKRKITGIKFLFDHDEFEQAEAKPLTTKMPYCVMVKRAMLGHDIKAVLKDFGCMASARVLGIIKPDEFFLSGRHYNRLGLYQNLTVSKHIRRNMTICQHQAYGVMVKPLENFTTEPDTVLMVCTPFEAMRLIQGHTHQFGYNTTFKIAGNQAICSECTAYPFESGDINISMLCAGTRFMAGWKEEELAIGLPFHRFMPLVEGLWYTLNPTETDRKKKHIEARLSQSKRSDLTIEYGKNYYSGLYQTQKS